jgi:hypothetical protein
VLTQHHRDLLSDTLDLSAYTGQTVFIDVVDAFEGGWGWLAFDEIKITNATLVTSVEENSSTVPAQYELAQNYPNPFNPSTNIQFQIPRDGYVTISVYNSIGQQVATLVDADLKSGVHYATFDAAEFPSGVYYYRIQAGDFTQAKKMLLLK